MNILVCIAKVPDTTTKITFTDNNTKLNTERVQFVINPLDEFALTRAIEIKEALGGKVTVINVGKPDTEPLIRKAFAIGADDGIRIDAEPYDAHFVAFQIAHYVKQADYDFILAGRETTDYGSCQVGAMLAEFLEWSSVVGVPKFDINGNEATMEREIEGGKELISVKTPFVATAQEGITEPRIASMRGIMSARTKPLSVVQPVNGDAFTSVKLYELPPPKGTCKFIDAASPEQLVDLLHNEAKII